MGIERAVTFMDKLEAFLEDVYKRQLPILYLPESWLNEYYGLQYCFYHLHLCGDRSFHHVASLPKNPPGQFYYCHCYFGRTGQMCIRDRLHCLCRKIFPGMRLYSWPDLLNPLWAYVWAGRRSPVFLPNSSTGHLHLQCGGQYYGKRGQDGSYRRKQLAHHGWWKWQ